MGAMFATSLDPFRDRLEKYYEDIRQLGYTFAVAEDDPPLLYTIGLSENFDHPEIVLVDHDDELTGTGLVCSTLVIKDGERLDLLTRVRLGRYDFDVRPVHRDRWRDGTFCDWHEYYERAGRSPCQRALQLTPVDWAGPSRRLDLPETLGGTGSTPLRDSAVGHRGEGLANP